jgi:hypothetical protein
MGPGLADVPILCSESVLDGVESDDLLEVVEHAIARRGVREISERSVSAATVSVIIQNIHRHTHGQDKMETTDIPMMMAALTR